MSSRGIGDVVWHVPILRRLAALTPEGQVTFLTRPTTHAADLLRHEPAVARVAYVAFQGKRHKFREVAALTAAFRELQPRAVWVLDQTAQASFAAFLAGAPERHGTGEGRLLQTAMLTGGPVLPRSKRHLIERLTHLMDVWGAPRVEGRLLIVGESEREAIRKAYAGLPRPWLAFGMTASHPPKVWPADRFAPLAVRVAGGGTAFFVGGPGDKALAEAAAAAVTGCTGVSVCGLPLNQLMALFEACDLYVGNDSGPLNVAAGVGVPALGLFGPTPPLSYTPNLACLVSGDGTMASITLAQAADRALALLAGARATPSLETAR